MQLDRRHFIRLAGLAGLSAAGLSACAKDTTSGASGSSPSQALPPKTDPVVDLGGEPVVAAAS